MVTRKAFLVRIVRWTGGGVVLALGGCGGGGSYSGSSSTPQAAGGCGASTITGNHGHELSIPSADLNSTTAMTYDIHGSADHTHQVTFSAGQLAQLKAGQAVTVTSSTTLSHSHDVTAAC
jgi:hypothetical protein